MEQAQTRLKSSGTSFLVDAVTPAAEPLLTETMSESVPERLQRKILVLPEAGELVINPYPMLRNQRTAARRIALRLSHPLIDAIHFAFSQHRPLTLSPDAIWMVITQGFGHHVAENAEELRGRLVRHKGKQELTVTTTQLTLESFAPAIALFSARIKRETDPVLHETRIFDVSTTSAAARTASEVAL